MVQVVPGLPIPFRVFVVASELDGVERLAVVFVAPDGPGNQTDFELLYGCVTHGCLLCSLHRY